MTLQSWREVGADPVDIAVAEAADTTVLPLPDDRTTRGDWYLGYGGEFYLLCAQNYLLDRIGGPGPEPRVRFSTTDPKEPGRLWVSAPSTDDPAALWDPARRHRVPANRDDWGEQCPIGGGPDLVLDCAIPEGSHILSLYFVNDHYYYEPNRRYTLRIFTAGSPAVLADVHNFGGGVYKRFLVRGAAELRIRVCRDASMNVLLQGVFLDSPWGFGADAGLAEVRAAFREAGVAGRRYAAQLSLSTGVRGTIRPESIVAAWNRLRTGGCHRELAWFPAQIGGRLVADDVPAALAGLCDDIGELPWDASLMPVGQHPLDPLWRGWFSRSDAVPSSDLEKIVLNRDVSVTRYARETALDRLLARAPTSGMRSSSRLAIRGPTVLADTGSIESATRLLQAALDADGLSSWREWIMRNMMAKLATAGHVGGQQVLANWNRLNEIVLSGRPMAPTAAALNTAVALEQHGLPDEAARIRRSAERRPRAASPLLPVGPEASRGPLISVDLTLEAIAEGFRHGDAGKAWGTMDRFLALPDQTAEERARTRFLAVPAVTITADERKQVPSGRCGETAGVFHWSVIPHGAAEIVEGGTTQDDQMVLRYIPGRQDSPITVKVEYVFQCGKAVGGDAAVIQMIVPGWSPGPPIDITGGRRRQ